MSVRLAPSILAADFAALGASVAAAERGGADMIHVDVMDGRFVPNISVGPLVVRALRRVTSLPLDVHLMIEDPDRHIPAFAEAGASLISVHVEALPHLHRTLAFIKGLGLKAGAVLNPSTPVGSLEEVAGDVDFVLLMTVNPGFGGQTFIPRSLSKIQAMRSLLDEAGNAAAIEVDGGIDDRTVSRVVAAGADWLVAGTAVFRSDDAEAAARRLRAAAVAAAQERLASPRGPR
ncbi:MAG TPA: ribulose-phosphate 3-epimerase [Vicinamibacterales bacterium]|nr:ribulose-phosphate 3-epimerase [Vicinamibacterales bacterium]HPW22117.1 ribulose-phosphate 3-epimerase [Vicinamibacterales bacterium]